MSNELKPCPFCGQQEAFVEQLDSDASVVICQGRVDEHSACLARGPVGVQESDNESQPGYAAAVREWNQRAANEMHAPGEESEVVYMLRNTEIGSPWRDANKAAFDSAAGMSSYERRELVDRKHIFQLQAEIERLQEANLHHRNLEIESDDVIADLREKLQIVPAMIKTVNTLLPYAEDEAANTNCCANAEKTWAAVENAQDLLEHLSTMNEELKPGKPAPTCKPKHEQGELLGWISTRQLDAFKNSRRSSWVFSVDRTESETRAIPIYDMRVKP